MLNEIEILSFKLSTFNLMMSLGLLSALLALLIECKKNKLNAVYETKVITAFPFGFLFGAFFAHIIDVYFHEGFFAIFSAAFFKYGITFLGSLIGGMLYLFLHAKITKLSYVYLLNFYLPLYALAQGFGRIGCFLGGCCFGKPCETFGLSYPEKTLPFSVYESAKLFPIQLIESCYLFIIFFAIIKFVSFNKRAATYLILMSIGRFIFEFARGDDRGSIFYNIISPSQFLCLCLFIVGSFIRKYQSSAKVSRIEFQSKLLL